VSEAYRPHYHPEVQALVFGAGVLLEDPLDAGRHVFVCGALQDPVRMTALVGRRAPFAAGAVRGFARVQERVGGREVPFMVPAESGGVLTGLVYLGLSDEELRAIEVLELAAGLRKRVEVAVVIGERVVPAATWIRA
jgi:hypothetical protein